MVKGIYKDARNKKTVIAHDKDEARKKLGISAIESASYLYRTTPYFVYDRDSEGNVIKKKS